VSEAGVFQRTRVVGEKDIDFLGHVNNVVWLRYVVQIAEAHAAAQGFDYETMRGLGAQWIVRRHEIDYHASAMKEEELIEETWVSLLKGARSIRHARFTRASDGARLVTSLTHWAYCDADTQRPKRIAPEVLAAFIPVDRD
jgi:acyl-CoA thioester hydrolase